MSSWTAAREAFAEHLAQSPRSEATCAGYLRHLDWLASSVTAGPWELTTHELAAWLDSHNWSRQTRRKVLVTFRRRPQGTPPFPMVHCAQLSEGSSSASKSSLVLDEC